MTTHRLYLSQRLAEAFALYTKYRDTPTSIIWRECYIRLLNRYATTVKNEVV